MQFPVSFDIGSLEIPAHLVFDVLATLVGTQVFLYLRRRGDPLDTPTRTSIIVAAALGAVVGGKVLALLVDPVAQWEARGSLLAWWQGKTIVGALVGGHLAVEWQKKRLGVVSRTGDLFAIPMVVAITIGRCGCFLTGLEDRTHGIATGTSWGMDFGDGILRHPTQLYEQVFLIGLLAYLIVRSQTSFRNGYLWKLFLGSYMTWRFAVGFIQPGATLLGLTAIQWVAAGVVVFYGQALVLAKPDGATHA